MHGTSISIIPEQRILILPHRPHTGTSHALDAGKKARKLASRAGRYLQGEAYREKPWSGEIGGAVGRPGRHVRPEQQTGTTDRDNRQEHQAGTPDRNTSQEHQSGTPGRTVRPQFKKGDPRMI